MTEKTAIKHILIVDDNKDDLALAQSLLSDIYRTTAVTSGERALDFLRDNTCDLILLDLVLPGMDGFKVIEKLKESDDTKDIPVIFLTAESAPETESRCIEAGAVDFIVNPFVPAVVLSRISRTLELAGMRRRLAERLRQKIQEVSDIRVKSHQDALTGLWNRAYAEETINEFIADGGDGAFFMIDMDNFKAINDNYGHIEGDKTLKMFAETMSRFAREGDVLCRIGGDEFVMFVNGVTSKAELSSLAQNIINDLAQKIERKMYEIRCTVSIGIAQVPEDGTDFGKVYNSADKALYYVKQNGKNSYHFFCDRKSDGGSTLVDLKYLREIMSRSDPNRGAYQLDPDSFRHVYNFIRRFMERNDRDVQTILFTVYSRDNTALDEIDTAVETLERAIYTSLRRADVSTRYSVKQVIVILMDTSIEDGSAVARRILDCFDSIYEGNGVKISYDIARMEEKS